MSADPGAGYVNPGEGHRGPFSRLAARLHLARIDPQTIIIQGGHDDIGRPLPLIRQRVESLIATIRREAPVSPARGAHGVPARGTIPGPPGPPTRPSCPPPGTRTRTSWCSTRWPAHWHFPRIGDHLHPTSAGHLWIAERLAAGLRGHQVAA